MRFSSFLYACVYIFYGTGTIIMIINLVHVNTHMITSTVTCSLSLSVVCRENFQLVALISLGEFSTKIVKANLVESFFSISVQRAKCNPQEVMLKLQHTQYIPFCVVSCN